MALDDATTQLIADMAAHGGRPMHELQPAEARAGGAVLAQMLPPGPDMARVDDHTLDVGDGASILVRTLVPVDDPDGVIVYFHGGGWVVGHIDEFDAMARTLAARTRCAIVLPNYRKAPENPFPAAVDDARRALRWAAESMTDIAGRPVPLIIAGDSSGGNLAAVAARKARDEDGPQVDLQVLIYPATDCDTESKSYLDPANQLSLNRSAMLWFWDHYAPPEVRSTPDASPLRAADLSGLPPAVVMLAEHDVLRSEGEAYAQALEAAGVPVHVELFTGQMHGFLHLVGLLPGSAAGIDFLAREITRRLNAANDSATL